MPIFKVDVINYAKYTFQFAREETVMKDVRYVARESRSISDYNVIYSSRATLLKDILIVEVQLPLLLFVPMPYSTPKALYTASCGVE